MDIRANSHVGQSSPPKTAPFTPPERQCTVPLADLEACDDFTRQMQDAYLYPCQQPEAALRLTQVEDQVDKKAHRALRSLDKKIQEDSGLSRRFQKSFQALKKTMSGPYQLDVALGQVSALQKEMKTMDRAQARRYQGNLERLHDELCGLKCLKDLPRQTADGLTRTMTHFVGPVALPMMLEKRGWEMAPDGIPIADAVVVGAGPGGMSASYNLAQRGTRVVCLEAGYAGQAFSDLGAKSVHCMRTNTLLSSLVRTGKALEDWATPIGIPANLADFRSHAATARQEMFERTGYEVKGLPREINDPQATETPIARAELFQHLQKLAANLAQDYDNSILIEQAPVTEVKRGPIEGQSGEFFKVTTAKGHEVYARKLVLSTGMVGTAGQFAKISPQFLNLVEQNPKQYVIVRDDQDLSTRHDELEASLNGKHPKQWIVADRMLGTQPVQLALQGLPEGASVAVIGSGESAAKAALEVLSQNPDVTVDLYVKAKIEAAQVQVPTENFSPIVLEKAVTDKDYGPYSLERFKKHFDTPITSRSVTDLFEYSDQGRVRIHELGAYFDEKSIQLTPGRGATGMQVVSDEVLSNLKAQADEYRSAGVTCPDGQTELPPASMFICAMGYDRKALRQDPVTQQLIDQGLVEIQSDHNRPGFGEPIFAADRLTSTRCPDVAFNTVGALGTASDSSLPGLAFRGRLLADRLCQDLPQRDATPVAEQANRQGAEWATYSREEFDGVVHFRGLHPNFVTNLEAQIHDETGAARRRDQQELEVWRNFPEDDPYLRELAQKDPSQLSDAERLTLQRAISLLERIGDPNTQDYRKAG